MTVARLEPNVPVISATASKKAAGKLLPPSSVPVRVYLKILSTIFTKAYFLVDPFSERVLHTENESPRLLQVLLTR